MFDFIELFVLASVILLWVYIIGRALISSYIRNLPKQTFTYRCVYDGMKVDTEAYPDEVTLDVPANMDHMIFLNGRWFGIYKVTHSPGDGLSAIFLEPGMA